jgi:hypothetical protein
VKLESALEMVAAYSEGDRLEGLKRHIDPLWIEEALAWSGVATLRRRRLAGGAGAVASDRDGVDAGRAYRANRRHARVGASGPKRTLIAKSAISQARQRLGDDPLAYLFTVSAAESARARAVPCLHGRAAHSRGRKTVEPMAVKVTRGTEIAGHQFMISSSRMPHRECPADPPGKTTRPSIRRPGH